MGAAFLFLVSFVRACTRSYSSKRLNMAKKITEVSRYALDGQRLDHPRRGLNIVKYSDGTVRKILVK